MNPTSIFIANLSSTCKGNSFIKENGKKLTIFDRISDFFQGKHNYDHFKSVCEKLPEGRVSDISQEEQIEILGRIREIQKKIKNNTVKRACEEHINRFESQVLTKENSNTCSQAVFHDWMEAIKHADNKKSMSCIRKLNAVIAHYSKDQESMGEILSNWNNCYIAGSELPPHTLKYFYRTSNHIMNKLLDIEETFLETDVVSDIHYEKYPVLLRSFLEQKFQTSHAGGVQERITRLSALMDRHADNPIFIENCMKEIDSLLENTVFLSKMPFLSEMKKEQLLLFKDFFPLINTHLPAIENTPLAQKLKIKFGNLPTDQARSSFPNLLLSQKEQLNILVDELQRREDLLMDNLVRFITNKRPFGEDLSRLAIFVGSSSLLSESNKLKLRTALGDRLSEIPENWENYTDVKDRLDNEFLLDAKVGVNSSLILSLKRTSKSKSFFQSQLRLDEDMILIPRWYHATSNMNIRKILNSGEIQVRHQKDFPGAWVSSSREERFGTHTLALSHKISNLDPNASIGYRYEDRRWRGLHTAIPITQDRGGVAIGVPNTNKTAQKIEKLRLIKILQDQGFPDPKAFSVKQLDFMQSQFQEILGNPNLSNEWW